MKIHNHSRERLAAILVSAYEKQLDDSPLNFSKRDRAARLSAFTFGVRMGIAETSRMVEALTEEDADEPV